MTASGESSSASIPSGSEGVPRSTWSKICRGATYIIWGIIGLFVVSQPFLRMWDSPFGSSIPNMISESMLIVGTVLALLWTAVFSQWSLKSKALVLVPACLLIGGFIASIRSLDLNGDIGITFEFKWEPTQAERIAAHKATLEAASKAAVSVEAGKTATPAVPPAAELPTVTPEDMPAYRGVKRDGVVIGPPIRTEWATPPKAIWQQPVGGGYASMAIVGDLLVTIEQRDDDEAVICYQASTGREVWLYKYPAHFWEAMGGPGPRSTPTIDGDLVFAQGAMGDLVCLDLATGELRWTKNLLSLFKIPNTEWGITASPLVIENHVIANAGGRRGDGLVAFDRSTGDQIWSCEGLKPSTGPTVEVSTTKEAPPADEAGHQMASEEKRNRPGYASPTLETILGVQQILNFDGTGLRGYAPATGKQLWFHPHENSAAVNAAQPILFEDGRIFISCSYDTGCAMVQVTHEGDTWGTKTLWENKNLRAKFSSAILFEGFIYGLDEGIMVCLDPATGARKWKKGRYNHGQLMLTNGTIVVLTENGRCVFVKPSPEGLQELGEFPALSDSYKTWNPPALVNGKLFVRNHHDMACYDIKQ